jgi:hypothetical protein
MFSFIVTSFKEIRFRVYAEIKPAIAGADSRADSAGSLRKELDATDISGADRVSQVVH